jgi:hypothetical protein
MPVHPPKPQPQQGGAGPGPAQQSLPGAAGAATPLDGSTLFNEEGNHDWWKIAQQDKLWANQECEVVEIEEMPFSYRQNAANFVIRVHGRKLVRIAGEVDPRFGPKVERDRLQEIGEQKWLEELPVVQALRGEEVVLEKLPHEKIVLEKILF